MENINQSAGGQEAMSIPEYKHEIGQPEVDAGLQEVPHEEEINPSAGEIANIGNDRISDTIDGIIDKHGEKPYLH